MKILKKILLIFSVLQINQSFAVYSEEQEKKFTPQEIFKKSRENLLIQAIIKGNFQQVINLLYAHVDPEATDSNTGKSALEIAQEQLETASGGNLTKRKQIVDLLKKEISRKNPESKTESLEEGFELISREKPKVIKLVETLNLKAQDYIDKKIREKELNQNANDFKEDILEELENIKQGDIDQALSLAQKYSTEYQSKIKKSMSNIEWAKWLYYGDPVTNFYSKIIATLRAYKG